MTSHDVLLFQNLPLCHDLINSLVLVRRLIEDRIKTCTYHLSRLRVPPLASNLINQALKELCLIAHDDDTN